MKKSFGIGLAAIAAAGLTVFIVKKATKKEAAKIMAAEEKENEEIESLGVSAARMRSQVLETENEADRNMVKAVYVCINDNPDNWAEDIINVDRALATNRILHITEERRARGGKNLQILFEIPDLSGGDRNTPKIGDFYTSFKQLKEWLWSNIVLYDRDLYGNMAVFMAYSIKNLRRVSKNDPEYISEVLELPKTVWSKWEGEHDGVYEFFCDAEENGLYDVCQEKGVWEIVNNLLTNDILQKNPEIQDLSVIAPRFEELRLMYKLSIRESSQPDDRGLTVKAALDTIRYITEEFTVEKRNGTGGKGIRYDKLLIHAPNEEGEFDSLTRYYTTKGFSIVEESYAYPPEEEESRDFSKVNNVFNAARH